MNLRKFLEPKSIAVIGVSTSNPFNPANVIYVKNSLRMKTRAYAVNPRGGSLHGERIYESVFTLPEKPDVAVICVKAEFVKQAVLDCFKAGVSGAIVVSGGFAEIGRGDMQQELGEISAAHKFPIIGPNCLGVYSPPIVDTFFLPHERLVEPGSGSVGLISQSGGILVDLMTRFSQENIGISRGISMGNKAATDEVDFLQLLDQDPQTKVIGLYLEGFKEGRGRKFVELVKKSSKPIVLLKAGKTPSGSKAVSSHTASLAGDYAVFADIMRRGGVREAKNGAEFISYCEALSAYPKNNIQNIVLITGSGGHGAYTSDICHLRQVKMIEIPEEDKEELKSQLSPSVRPIVSIGNPVDLTGSATNEDFYAASKFFMAKPYIDAVVLLLLPYIPGINSDIGARISQLSREFKKPILVYIPRVSKFEMFIEGFESNGVPVSHTAEGAIMMAEALTKR